MKWQRHNEGRGGRAKERGFTLIEIAICLGIIGFALVAIIGILPAGLQTQRDNREDTIINQEGAYFMEAIRNGAEDLGHLDGMVDFIEIRPVTNKNDVLRFIDGRPPNPPIDGDTVVSFLSRPSDLNLPTKANGEPVEVRMVMRPSSGSAAENADVGFRYQVTARNFAFTTAAAAFNPVVASQLTNYLREVRLEFRWPVLPGDRVGSGRQMFRSMVSGSIVPDPRVVQGNGTVTDNDRWLFRQ